MLFLNGAGARKQVRQYEQGVTMKRINLGNLRRIMIAVPSIVEQDLIIQRMNSVKAQLNISDLQLTKLRNEKIGLMNDLLTGHVRVTPLLETTTP